MNYLETLKTLDTARKDAEARYKEADRLWIAEQQAYHRKVGETFRDWRQKLRMSVRDVAAQMSSNTSQEAWRLAIVDLEDGFPVPLDFAHVVTTLKTLYTDRTNVAMTGKIAS